MINLNEINLFKFSDVRDLEWELRVLMLNNEHEQVLGNCSHHESSVFSNLPEKERFSYLSFQVKDITNNTYTFARFGIVRVSELKKVVFINELPIEEPSQFIDSEIISYPEDMEVVYSTSEIDDMVKREANIDLKATFNGYNSRI